ncbi:MAG: bacillithiol biosynthesis cysteine-adding enzyme BshC [Flavobacteriales bacterium]|nr:bacillithiol biosynthesis cysteine-adding enzyme BshC [Flavobacteriales bacterium]
MSFKRDILTLPELDVTKRGKQLFPQIFKDYINEEAVLDGYYQFSPNLSSFKEAIQSKSQESIDRATLVKVLQKQYAGIQDAPANIARLGDDDTFSVTTGHQLCLFTGPLYLCYKILTIVNLAEKLKEAYPDKNFVPVFWMATEDHDFEEINHFYLFGKKVTWEEDAGNAVGRMSTKGLQSVIDDLRIKLASDASAGEVLQIFEKAYTNWDNLADATRFLVHELFGKYGVVVLDADDPDLKKRFVNVMKAEIESNASMHAMAQAYAKLSGTYKLPVKSREINLFYFEGDKRLRLEPGDADTVNLIGSEISFSKNGCLKLIEEDPERFSPNVVLRPLYQEMILPNLAYIGGPSEVGYWLELKGIFDENKVSFPVLMPRNSLAMLGANEVKRMAQFNLSLSDLFSDPAEQLKTIINANADVDLSVTAEKEELTMFFDKLATRVSILDAGLEKSVKADLSRVLAQLDNLEKKLVKSAKNKNESMVNQVNRLLESLYPNGVFQERYASLFSMLIRYDLGIIDEMKACIEPFDTSLKVLSEVVD